MLSSSLSEHPCLIHRRERITYVCEDSRCLNNPFLCPQCIQENVHKTLHNNHQELLAGYVQSIPQMSQKIWESKAKLQNMYENTIGSNQNQEIMRTVEQGQMHYREVQDGIRCLRSEVEKEIDLTLMDITKRVGVYKQSIFAAIDNYLQIYIQNMEAYRLIVEPLLSFNTKYKYYSSGNNLGLKLMTQTRQNSPNWYLDLKRVQAMTAKILEQPQQYFATLSRSTVYIKQMLDEQPQAYQNVFQQKRSKVHSVVEELFSGGLGMREIKPLQIYLNQNNQVRSADKRVLIRPR